MNPGKVLFTRQQVSELTGIPEDVLNYWMRENVIRPAEGGGGKGQHRRFRYSEINLAAILNEVRQFGANLASLRSLATVFHASADWAAGNDMSPNDLRLVHIIHGIREHFSKHGFYPAAQADFPERAPDGKGPLSGEPKVYLRSWVEVVDWLARSPFYRDELGADFEPRHFDLAGKTDPSAVSGHWDVLRRIVGVPDAADTEYFPLNLARSPDGGWKLITGTADANKALVSFIGINTSRLIYEMWNR